MGRWTVFRLTGDATADGQRLDQWVAGQVPELSRGFVRKVIDLGGIHLNGRRIRKCSLPVAPHDKVEIFLDGRSLEPFVLSGKNIIYRDQHLLAVDKPPDLDTQPTPARFKGTLYQALKRYLQDPVRPQLSPSLGMVQRLDRDTSGVMVFSIHPRAHKNLTAAFSQREVRKIYLALTFGVPPAAAGEIRSALARSRNGNRVRSVPKGGKPATTRYHVLTSDGDVALVAVEIPTGRSHQIRAHFSEAGFPLAGDEKYGAPNRIRDISVPRHMLHSRLIRLKHPVSRVPMTFEAPLPEDMASLLKMLGMTIPDVRTPLLEQCLSTDLQEGTCR